MTDDTVVKMSRSTDGLATAHKENIAAAMAILVNAMEAARKDGFLVELNISLDAYGRYGTQALSLIKRY